MPDFRLTLDSFIIYGGNVGLECLYRTFGLSSSSGAHLSITQSFGFAAGLLLLHKKNRSIIIIPLCILCISSTVFVGRTGLLLSVFFFIVYFLFSLKKKSKVVLSLLALLLIAAVNVKWVDLFAGQLNKIDNFSSDYFVEWLSEGFEISNNKTVNALLQEQEVPELTIKNFFIGTGTVTTEDGKNTSGHDSGYIQTYYSLGLLPAFIFYISFILFVYKSFKKYDTEIIYLINFVILALEIKEPVLFKYSEGIILLTFLWIIKNTYSNSKNICVVST
jgi:hypothetical protein